MLPAVFFSQRLSGSQNSSLVRCDIGEVDGWVQADFRKTLGELLLQCEHAGPWDSGIVTVGAHRDDDVSKGSLGNQKVLSFTLIFNDYLFTTFLKRVEVAEIDEQTHEKFIESVSSISFQNTLQNVKNGFI
jgi:hypothetical protein